MFKVTTFSISLFFIIQDDTKPTNKFQIVLLSVRSIILVHGKKRGFCTDDKQH